MWLESAPSTENVYLVTNPWFIGNPMVIEGRHLYTSIVPRMEKDRLSVQADPDEIETSDLDTPGASERSERMGIT